MNASAQWRAGGVVVALLIGLGVPSFLVGPALFASVSWSVLSPAQVGWCIAAFCFGVWLFLVSCLAESDEVQKVVEPFQGAEAVIFFLPYMLWVGTRSIARRARRAIR
jgi:hypothetical protein